MVFLDELRELIAKEDALEDVAERLSSYLRTLDRALYNETLGQSGRLVSLRQERRRGVLTDQQYDAKRAALRHALLDLVDEVERASKRLPLPAAQSPVEPMWPEPGALEAIIGANRIQSIAWLRRGLDVARSVCRITTQKQLGTGFLIDGGWIVTNYHVLPDRATAAGTTAEFNVEEDANKQLQTPCAYAIDPSTWRADAKFDCAMVKTAAPCACGAEIGTWGALSWAPATQVPIAGDYVSIIQHPEGGLKRITVSENQVVNVYEHRLQYTTDTMKGSSGSPVFDDAWRVVALHHAGGNLVTNLKGDKRFINQGILAEHVRRALGLGAT